MSSEQRATRPETIRAPTPPGLRQRRAAKHGQVRAGLAGAAAVAVSAFAAGGIQPAAAHAPGNQAASGAARLTHIVNLPGYRGLVDPNGRTIYLVHGSSASAEIIAFDWRRRRIVWRAPDKGFLWPVGISRSALVLVEYLQGGPVTSGPLAALDRKTGRTLWKQPSSTEPEGNNGVALVGDRILKALPGKVVCMSAASGREIWSRDIGVQMSSHDWPYPPAEAAGSVVTQLVTDQTRVVALDSRNGQTRWSHAFPWTVDFFEAGSDVRYVGPQAAAGSSVVALVPSGVQPQGAGHSDTSFPLPPPSTLYCWDARTGGLRWSQSAPWTNDPPLVGARAIVLLRYSLTYGREVGAIGYSLATGRPLWHLEGHFLEESEPPGQHPHGVVLQQSEQASNDLLSVDPLSGHIRWRCRLPPTAYIQVPLVTCTPGRILAIDEGYLGINHWSSRLLVMSIPRGRHPSGRRARLRRTFGRHLALAPTSPERALMRKGSTRPYRHTGSVEGSRPAPARDRAYAFVQERLAPRPVVDPRGGGTHAPGRVSPARPKRMDQADPAPAPGAMARARRLAAGPSLATRARPRRCPAMFTKVFTLGSRPVEEAHGGSG